MSLMTMAAVAIAACGSEPAVAPRASTTTSSLSRSLDGRTFLTTSITDDGKPKILVANTRISIGFNEATLTTTGSCNIGSGKYSIIERTLRVELMQTTEMACEESRMAQDD